MPAVVWTSISTSGACGMVPAAVRIGCARGASTARAVTRSILAEVPAARDLCAGLAASRLPARGLGRTGSAAGIVIFLLRIAAELLSLPPREVNSLVGIPMRDRAVTRRLILDAAYALFYRHGYARI